ncbi:MAG: hypothetical protein QM704_14345 [Anaeromyxobacteraceae bacterium]
MALLAGAYRLALWLAPVTLVLGVVLLSQSIAGVFRTSRRARVATVPLAAEQEVVLAAPGPVVLTMEGPIFTRPPELTYALAGPDGAIVSQRPVLFRMSSSGLSRGTLQLRRFVVTAPGPHTLRIEGLGRSLREQDCLLFFERPHAAETVAWVLGIIGAGFLIVGSLVTFFLRLARVGLDG